MNSASPSFAQTTEILIMPDGTIYVHNLTPEMALALSTLNPEDEKMRARIPLQSPEPTPASLSPSAISRAPL